MRIGRFEKLTLVGFPGKVAAVVYTQGCNFRCGPCPSPELVCPHLFEPPVPEQQVLEDLDARRHLLNGLVITGGEPTAQKDLSDFLIRVKHIGLQTKLQTNGSRPEILASLMEAKLVDFIAMDIKTSIDKYKFCDPQRIKESISLIINSELPYQFTTSLVKSVCSIDDLHDIREALTGAKSYILQPAALSEHILDPLLLQHEQYSPQEVEALKMQFEVCEAVLS